LNGERASLGIGTEGNPGDILIQDGTGRTVVHLNGERASLGIGTEGNPGDISVQDKTGKAALAFDSERASLGIGTEGNPGDILVQDGTGRTVVHLNGERASLGIGNKGNPGDITVQNGSGKATIHLSGQEGDIQLLGADCAEDFDVVESEMVEPGTVLVIHSQGGLRPCREAYDKKVAGVVSGANGAKPAVILDRNPAHNKRLPIALNGKVYCKVDAQYSPIEIGDLLTTSPSVGHAMKAEDSSKVFGAVIGKALRGLETGQGLIPILVSLQ
jgi:hypothetical protein